jgi:hypothetical protein
MDVAEDIESFFIGLKSEALDKKLKSRILRGIEEIEKIERTKNEYKHEGETARWCLESSDFDEDHIDKEMRTHWSQKAGRYSCLVNSCKCDEEGILLRMPGLKIEEEARAKLLIPIVLKERGYTATSLRDYVRETTPLPSEVHSPLAVFPRGCQKSDHKPFTLLLVTFFKKTNIASKWAIVSQTSYKQLRSPKFWIPADVVVMLNLDGKSIWLEDRYSAKFLAIAQQLDETNSWPDLCMCANH